MHSDPWEQGVILNKSDWEKIQALYIRVKINMWQHEWSIATAETLVVNTREIIKTAAQQMVKAQQVLEDLCAQQAQVMQYETQLYQNTDAVETVASPWSIGKCKAIEETQQKQNNNTWQNGISLVDDSNIEELLGDPSNEQEGPEGAHLQDERQSLELQEAV